MLFTYAIIIASHIRFRKRNGCPPEGKCQMPGYPYTSWIALISMIIIFISMPFIPGQGIGLITGIVLVAIYSFIYLVMRYRTNSQTTITRKKGLHTRNVKPSLVTEFSEEPF